jgi:hypothetical protein
MVPAVAIAGTALGYYYLLRKPEIPFVRRFIGVFTTPIIAALIGMIVDRFLPTKIELAKIPLPPPPPLELTSRLEAEAEVYASYYVFNYVGGPISLGADCEFKATHVLAKSIELSSLIEAEASIEATYSYGIELSSLLESEAAITATYELT